MFVFVGVVTNKDLGKQNRVKNMKSIQSKNITPNNSKLMLGVA